MFDRKGRDAIGRLGTGSRGRFKAGRRLRVEPLEGRALMAASLAPIAAVTSPQFQGFQVPLQGGTDPQTYSVTSDNPGVKASIAQGQFWTITVAHTSSGAGDPTINGSMTFQLFQDLTPNTVQQIESLITGTATNLSPGVSLNGNYYVGKKFHRIASGFPSSTDFIVQGGSLNGDGTGNAFARPFPDEFNQQLAFTGTGQLAMANAGSDTNDSQFFITTGSPAFLNYHHTIFGQIVSGRDVLQQLTQVAKGSDGQTPVNPVTITADSLSNTNPNGVVHLDTTLAPANGTAHVTVTATDTVDRSTTSQTFTVNVSAFDTTNPDRPFLGPIDPTINIGSGQTAKFQLSAVATPPGDPLTFTVQGGTTTTTSNGTTTTTFTPVQNASASVSAGGLVTVTPNPGFTGAITLLVGVRDQTNRAGTGVALDSPANYETHKITLNVSTSTTPVALRPLAQQAQVNASTVGSTPIQLVGTNPNSGETKPLTFTITTQPTHGTITAFNASTGSLNYTPTAGYIGPDAFQYTVNDPNSNLSSFPTTISITVSQASTGAVRFIADDGSNSTTTPGNLVVTPLPRTNGGTNIVGVAQVNGNVQVTVNGVLDTIQPALSNVDSVIVYGSKANDRVTIDPALAVPVTLSGGTGGHNVLAAGGGPTRQQGWYGTTVEKQGSSNNFLFGRRGSVSFVKGPGSSDVIFAGTPKGVRGHSRVRQIPPPPGGTYFTFSGGKLVKAPDPFAARPVAHKATARKK
jgi:peptidyl-prolyl cis-trans isomerase A (cyclophilin A)